MERTQQGYRMRWKGRETGPLPLDEIERRLRDREVGLMHEVREGNRWLTLREFLGKEEEKEAGASVQASPAPAAPDAEPAAREAPPPPLVSYTPPALLFLLLCLLAFLPEPARIERADLLSGSSIFLGLAGAAAGLIQIQRSALRHGLVIASASLLLAVLNMALVYLTRNPS